MSTQQCFDCICVGSWENRADVARLAFELANRMFQSKKILEFLFLKKFLIFT